MAKLRLFAHAREAAGLSHDEIEATTVDELLTIATTQYGTEFAKVLAISKVWVNGEQTDLSCSITSADEVAVLPPVSGGFAA